MITRLYVDNFKSLVGFELKLAHFTCLIGLNGAGQITVLQALVFARAIMLGEVIKMAGCPLLGAQGSELEAGKAQ